MDRVIFFLAFVLVVGVGLYFFNTGVISKNVSSFGSFLAPASGTRPLFGSSSGFTSPGSVPRSTIGSPTNTTPSGNPASNVNPSDIPAGFTLSQISPFFHKFHVSGSPGPNGIITISNSLSQKESVDVTGWQIRTNRSGEFIPRAVMLYNPFGTAFDSDIRLTAGDYLTIYSNSAPVNVRINKCMGYLNNTNQFNPPLPQSCPQIDRSEIQTFTGACQNYIFSIGGCQTANLGDPRIPQNDPACISYIENHFSYRSCFDTHQTDPDFLSHEVRVWIGGNPLDQFHDRVMLMDGSGLLVDYYSY